MFIFILLPIVSFGTEVVNYVSFVWSCDTVKQGKTVLYLSEAKKQCQRCGCFFMYVNMYIILVNISYRPVMDW